MPGTGMQVGGSTAGGFEPVRDAFARQAAEVGDGGAAFAATAGGRLVVDLWAGQAGPRPWSAPTRAVLMSATKGIVATAVALLADRSLLDVEAPVADYWPEFAATGKAEVSIAQLLSHSAGLISVPGYADLLGGAGEGWEQTSWVLKRLEAASPWWAPGAHHGYHGITFGWLVGELVRRVSGSSVGTVIREEIAGPLGLELDLGTPAERQHLVAPVILAGPPLTGAAQDRQLADPASLLSQMILAVNGRCILNTADAFFAGGARLAMELPALNATGTARALARLYGVLAREGRSGDLELLSPKVIDLFARERRRGPSRVTGDEERWGLGFQRPVQDPVEPSHVWGPHDEAFGHTGLGGQVGFADPVSQVSVALVRSHLSSVSPLGGHLVSAFYSCL
jgi:CubicO group peptidase (beta-lactamase class C family)